MDNWQEKLRKNTVYFDVEHTRCLWFMRSSKAISIMRADELRSARAYFNKDQDVCFGRSGVVAGQTAVAYDNIREIILSAKQAHRVSILEKRFKTRGSTT